MLRISKVMHDAFPDPDPTFSSDADPEPDPYYTSGFHFVTLETAETG
jgi:hypothetical protein